MRCLLTASLLLLVAVFATSTNPQKRSPKKDEQDLSKVPGVPGVDYPLFRSVPHTNFHCGNVPYAPGMYANVETGCQAYHVCHDGREGEQGASFLCPNGTLFNQHEFACDWWYNVNCGDATRLYDLNLDPSKNPFTPKKKPEEQLLEGPQYHEVAQPQFHAVAQPQYHAVAQPQYHAVAQPQYHAVAQPQYHAVAQPQYHAVAQPQYRVHE